MAQTKAQLVDISTTGISAGSASAPSITFTGDLNTGIYSPGADQVSFTTGGTERLRIDSTGQIESVSLGTAAAPTYSFTTDPNTGIYSPGADQVAISTNGANRFQIDSSGNITVDTNTFYVDAANNRVGIGTTSPNGILHTSASNAVNIFESPGISSVGLRFRTNNADRWQLQVPSASADLALYTGAAASEVLRVDSSGRLLVGTSSDLSGGGANTSFQLAASSGSGVSTLAQIYSFNSGGGVAALELCRSKSTTLGTNTTVANNDYIGSLNFKGANGSSYLAAASISCEIDGAVSGGGAADMPGRLVFSTTADGASSPTERMRIASTGAIKINTTATSLFGGGEIFSVDGGSANTGIGFKGTNSSTMLGIWNTISTSTLISFAAGSGGTIVGSISTNGSTTAYNTSSDYRLKENVTEVTDGIIRLQQLKPSRFNFIIDPSHTVDGFLAHEVQAVVPEAITGEKDAVDDEGNPIYQGIDQSKLVPLLTAALQEAIGEIESLKARVAALESA